MSDNLRKKIENIAYSFCFDRYSPLTEQAIVDILYLIKSELTAQADTIITKLRLSETNRPVDIEIIKQVVAERIGNV